MGRQSQSGTQTTPTRRLDRNCHRLPSTALTPLSNRKAERGSSGTLRGMSLHPATLYNRRGNHIKLCYVMGVISHSEIIWGLGGGSSGIYGVGHRPNI